jgi:hypothetical protein
LVSELTRVQPFRARPSWPSCPRLSRGARLGCTRHNAWRGRGEIDLEGARRDGSGGWVRRAAMSTTGARGVRRRAAPGRPFAAHPSSSAAARCMHRTSRQAELEAAERTRAVRHEDGRRPARQLAGRAVTAVLASHGRCCRGRQRDGPTRPEGGHNPPGLSAGPPRVGDPRGCGLQTRVTYPRDPQGRRRSLRFSLHVAAGARKSPAPGRTRVRLETGVAILAHARVLARAGDSRFPTRPEGCGRPSRPTLAPLAESAWRDGTLRDFPASFHHLQGLLLFK